MSVIWAGTIRIAAAVCFADISVAAPSPIRFCLAEATAGPVLSTPCRMIRLVWSAMGSGLRVQRLEGRRFHRLQHREHLPLPPGAQALRPVHVVQVLVFQAE